jgi:hypothetical protein
LFQNKIDESISLIKYNLDNTPIKESTTEVKTYLQNAFNNLDNHFHSRIWENFILKQINTIPENVAFNLFKLLNDYDFEMAR